MEPVSLGHLQQQARSAYNWTSFDPERRGDNTVKEFEAELNEDLLKLEKLGADHEQLARYKERYERRFSSWLGSMSNCASSFITGGSNFPVEKMRKRNQWAQNKYDELQQFRSKVIAAYEKHARRAKQREQEEKYGGEAGIARHKLENLEKFQETMKTVNNAHKAYMKNPSLESLEPFKLSDDLIQRIVNYVPAYSWEPHPFAPYQLTNNGAEIRRMKLKVHELENKEVLKETGNNEFPFEKGMVLLNHEIDRIQILYNEKPDYDTIKGLKKNGFHWSPTNKAWQRQITNNAKYATQLLIGIKF